MKDLLKLISKYKVDLKNLSDEFFEAYENQAQEEYDLIERESEVLERVITDLKKIAGA